MPTTQTRISDLVPNPGVLANVVAKTYETSNTLTTSGLATTGPEVDLLMAGGSNVQRLAYINKVDTSNYNHSTDDYDQKGAVGKITASGYSALRQDINWGWAYTDLVRMITRFAPGQYVAQAIPAFWTEVGENMAVAAMRGAVAADAAMTLDLSTNALDLALIVDAGTAFKGGAQNLIVNRKGEAEFKKLNINAYVSAKETDLNVAQFAGYNLFVSDKLEDGEMLIGGNGALAFATGIIPGTVPMEVNRDPNAGNGGGGEILRTRRSFVVAPQGFNYDGSDTPDLEELADEASWTRVADLDDVAFRLVKFQA